MFDVVSNHDTLPHVRPSGEPEIIVRGSFDTLNCNEGRIIGN